MTDNDREQKNAVFNQPKDPMAVTAAEVAKRSGFELPTALPPLPSRGLVYPVGSQLNGKTELEIYGMTPVQEDILMNPVFVKKGTVISELIKSSLVDRSIDPDTLISGDRNTIMIFIRITGYGPEYKAQITCPKPECEVRQEYNIDLTKTALKFLEVEPVKPGTNEFAFSMPVSKRNVTFKFLTGKEEQEILQTAEAKKKKGLLDNNPVTMRLLHSLLSVDGDYDRSKVANFVRFMPAGDSRALRSYIEKIEPTIDMKTEFTCNVCGHSEVITAPISADFFYPRS